LALPTLAKTVHGLYNGQYVLCQEDMHVEMGNDAVTHMIFKTNNVPDYENIAMFMSNIVTCQSLP
jgi:hypothetical protein